MEGSAPLPFPRAELFSSAGGAERGQPSWAKGRSYSIDIASRSVGLSGEAKGIDKNKLLS
jgi:hypothetical protein